MMTIETRLLTTVYSPEDQLIYDWLTEAGIDVFIQKRGISPIEVSIGPLAEIKLYVRVEQYEEARQVLAAISVTEEDNENNTD
ncbi:MAG: putative signal transducing protein [Methylocystaceae bacterium]